MRRHGAAALNTSENVAELYIPELCQLMVEMKATKDKACVLLMWYFRQIIAQLVPGGNARNLTIDALYSSVLLQNDVKFEVPKEMNEYKDDENDDDKKRGNEETSNLAAENHLGQKRSAYIPRSFAFLRQSPDILFAVLFGALYSE